jgi:HAD superfamily hydrolase (TIGR01490 family)
MLADVYGRTPSPSPDTTRPPSPATPAGPLSKTGLDHGATATPAEAPTAEGVTKATPSSASPTTRTSAPTRTSGGTQTPSSAPLSTPHGTTPPRYPRPAGPASDPGEDPSPVAGEQVAAFFDLDKTIIAGSSTLAFSGPLRDRGLIGRRALLRSGYAQLLLMVAGADANFMERMRDRISALCIGWEVAEVRTVIEQALGEILQPMIYAEAAALIAGHHREGHQVIVVSASGEEMVQPIAAALGAEHCAATRMAVADGRYTGEIDFYCYGEGKAVAARELAQRHGYRLEECYAYSDSITDLPLLELVGHPHAVNPDRALRRAARAQGWPVLNFVAPIPLHIRLGSRVRSLLPAPAASMAFAVGGVVLVAVLGARWFGRQSVAVRPANPG